MTPIPHILAAAGVILGGILSYLLSGFLYRTEQVILVLALAVLAWGIVRLFRQVAERRRRSETLRMQMSGRRLRIKTDTACLREGFAPVEGPARVVAVTEVGRV